MATPNELLNAQIIGVFNSGACNTALFLKGDTVALVAMTTLHPQGGAIYRYDPRAIPSLQQQSSIFTTGEEAKRGFNKSVQTTKENGWRLFHMGAPNFG